VSDRIPEKENRKGKADLKMAIATTKMTMPASEGTSVCFSHCPNPMLSTPGDGRQGGSQLAATHQIGQINGKNNSP
jgi:hypothetical protein